MAGSKRGPRPFWTYRRNWKLIMRENRRMQLVERRKARGAV